MLVLIILASTAVHAQDILVLRSGNTMKVQVVEVAKKNVRYYDWGSKTQRVYVVPVSDIISIKYANGTTQTFDQEKTEKARVDSFGRHTKSWTFNGGGGIILSNTSVDKWKGGVSGGLEHQFGYQMTNNVNLSIGGEFMYFSSQTDTSTVKEKSGNTLYRISYLGIPITLNLVELGKPSGLYFSVEVSQGVRYCNQLVKQNLSYAIKGSFSGGVGLKTGRTYFQIGAYAEYISFGSNYDGLGYGIRVTTIR